MAFQDIINSSVNIEINRSKLVAQNVSRSGRISVASRNWANPFRFVVTPKPIWKYDEYRSIFEPIFTADRYTTHNFAIADYSTSTGVLSATNMEWLVAYQGDLDTTPNNDVLDNYTATSKSGTSLTITKSGSPTIGAYIVKAGDYIRFQGFTYPYIVSSDVQVSASATATITVHRGILDSFSAGTSIFVGYRGARFNAKVTKLPQIRFLPGKFVEFTGDFELIEDIT
jgi:hypothetical protein